ncbi:MAG: hypothetical protein H7Z16_17065 [Pyrinomonadaceae bacterium]|nr:hypothetical protein [Pyrinomonadaceae bacterium]
MTNLGRARRISSDTRLLNLMHSEFPDTHQAADLLEEFLRHRAYSRKYCLRLLSVARQGADFGWDIRRLAVLMLEHQILKLPSENLEQFDFLLAQLKLKPALGLSIGVYSSVLREGFSTTELRPFVRQFRTRLERLNRIHDQIKGKRTSDQALREFIELSRRDCKLSLARYLFTPDEIVDEIIKQLRVTDGIRDLDKSEPERIQSEMTRAIHLLPDFEARVLRKLCQRSNIYWVSEGTSSRINSLVEYPITTVVLVIKLPGSDTEFEIKRAGRPGEHSLDVVYSRNGYTVPPSHRLDGGSMQWLLRYEANNATKLARIYRLVHGVEAPMSNYISRASVNSVPAGDGKARTLSYFTQPEMFGEGFRGMRRAMKDSIAAFRSEGNKHLPQMPGDWGMTAQFLGQVQPAQAILTGTSSFRLDKLAAYLSVDGSERYFKSGLKADYSPHEAKVFADEILEEILGYYQPPREPYQNHDQYLAAAFSVAENRTRADQVYKSLLQQIAKFWGTLLAVRGYSRGESFVARNVGLRSFWNKGQWDVKIIFMDHDALVIPNSSSGRFFAHGDVPNMTLDERYIWERSRPERFAASEVGCLHTIYRVGKQLDEEGQAVARVELKNAYRTTQQQMLTNPELQHMFSKGVVERIRDWDTLVRGYLQMNGDKRAAVKWKKEMKKMLAASGYKQDMFDAYVATIEKNRPFLTRQAFLFDSEAEKHAKLEPN